MVIDSNRRISDVAKELGLRSNLLGIWKKRYEFIKQFREAFPVVLMCQLLEVGRSGFYAWLSRAESPQVAENKRLVVAIKTIHRESCEAYGSPRVYSAMKRKGISCGKHRVARLMRDHNIRSRHKRKFKMTTDSNHRYPVAENILDRKFKVSKPDTCWASDITYIPTREGWFYSTGRLLVGLSTPE